MSQGRPNKPPEKRSMFAYRVRTSRVATQRPTSAPAWSASNRSANYFGTRTGRRAKRCGGAFRVLEPLEEPQEPYKWRKSTGWWKQTHRYTGPDENAFNQSVFTLTLIVTVVGVVLVHGIGCFSVERRGTGERGTNDALLRCRDVATCAHIDFPANVCVLRKLRGLDLPYPNQRVR